MKAELRAGRANCGSGPLAGLNKGAMAAFLARPKPLDLGEVSFAGADGAAKSLSDWRGKVVLLNIWATWCVPCREEMPTLDKLEAELGSKDFQVVTVNIDRGAATSRRPSSPRPAPRIFPFTPILW